MKVAKIKKESNQISMLALIRHYFKAATEVDEIVQSSKHTHARKHTL